mmetsp:Transcript_18368/g.37932  ORF Transcript_18368/g.37932 Transcript_18368/m.37932 type:complete len:90 (-) Transcript_18368:964-1233(-)
MCARHCEEMSDEGEAVVLPLCQWFWAMNSNRATVGILTAFNHICVAFESLFWVTGWGQLIFAFATNKEIFALMCVVMIGLDLMYIRSFT